MRQIYTKTFMALAIATAATPAAFADWGTPSAPSVLIENAGDNGPKTARTSKGETYVVWPVGQGLITADDETFGYALYAQLLDANGNKLWGEDGIIVDKHASPTWYSYWNIIVTPEDELVISWTDARSEEGPEASRYDAMDPVLYKLDREGKMIWGEEGMALDNTQYKYPPQLFLVGNNLYAKCYLNAETLSSQLLLINEFGEPEWSAGKNFGGQIIASEEEDFIAVYSSSNGVVAMRYNKDMRQRWKKAAVISEHQYGGHDLNPYTLVSDGQGGVIVCYPAVLGDFSSMPVVGYVTASGEAVFGEYAATTTSGNHAYPIIGVNTNTENIVTVWQGEMGAGTQNLQAQRLDYFGERLWGEEEGKAFCSKYNGAGWGYGPISVKPLNDEQWLMLYADELSYGQNQMYLAIVDNEGNIEKSLEIAEPNYCGSPQMHLEGDEVYITWVEDHTFVNEDGVDDGYVSLMGARVTTDLDGIESISSETVAGGAEEYYTIDGIRLSAPQKGINIVRKSDGSVSKVIF